MDLKTADVRNLQTKYMRDDPAVKGYSAALTEQVRKLAGEVVNVEIMTRIDDLPEPVLDVLAWMFSADWYDPNSDLQTKREAINDALILARIKGTPAAVEKAVELYFGDGQVQEWFEYGGTGVPGTFRVITSNPAVTHELSQKFIQTLNRVKRLSAHLDSIVITDQIDLDFYFAGIVHAGDNLIIDFRIPSFDFHAYIDSTYMIDDERIFVSEEGIDDFLNYFFGLEPKFII